jgi:hypothetical protein
MMSALLLIPEIEDGPHAPYQPTELPFSGIVRALRHPIADGAAIDGERDGDAPAMSRCNTNSRLLPVT